MRADLRKATLDKCILRRVKAVCANFKGASMKYVDASRADLRGACLVGDVSVPCVDPTGTGADNGAGARGGKTGDTRQAVQGHTR